ncbi:peptidase M10A and M12B matrixin and adamalysin [Clostridium sp. DL-VIII]|uniref:matrixin family metalloprotease n=1 Tax=Clostridium sp. DL-VIII TaxID=641107 RepID=UPI00023B0446|nr:matrixin family metalloprotease [Clostridium sp. DL-VIII]EHJ00730.1 peptidase M10A and M12B matrixin and adamalysin [Clostridium sp. DL-VIII]
MKRRNFIISLLVCSSVVVSNAIPAFAYNTYNDHVLIGGVNGIKYHIADSASSIESTIDSAVSGWNNANCGVSLIKNEHSQSVNKIVVYDDEDEDTANGIIAYTKFYLPNITRPDKWTRATPNVNWTQNHIIVNPGMYKNLAYDQQLGTIAHELGHAFGLAHVNDTSDLMYPKMLGVYLPQSDDIAGIKHLYGNSLNSLAVSTTSAAATNDNDSNNSDFSYIETTEDSIKDYTDINDLTNNSSTIIQEKIQDAESFYDEDGIYTNVSIKVEDSLAGTLKTGDVINVKLHGGTIEGKNAKEFSMRTLGKSVVDNDNVSSKKLKKL